ncbi:hypothetical protein C5C39_09735 [Rathayibacter sp. AY1F3]|uniref:hypothetical protein n=1 Tax=Rathayibacter sp. AY1F3 TaxID=2080558 RepID=UPI000CE915B2|nr:hypothetical protein [Rathayibacter sp. AY1F3]PPG90871.1 hypothetical protein C5C39_09735 [Rathayibacter sp. AY1F3]
MQTTTVPQTVATTYVPLNGKRSVSVVGADFATTPSVYVTRRPSGTWEAWHSDQLHAFTSGSFRRCVAAACRAALHRHASAVTR